MELAAPCCLPAAVQASLLAVTSLYLLFHTRIPALYVRKLTAWKVPSCFALQTGTRDVSLEAALQGLAGRRGLTALAGGAAFP